MKWLTSEDKVRSGEQEEDLNKEGRLQTESNEFSKKHTKSYSLWNNRRVIPRRRDPIEEEMTKTTHGWPPLPKSETREQLQWTVPSLPSKRTDRRWVSWIFRIQSEEVFIRQIEQLRVCMRVYVHVCASHTCTFEGIQSYINVSAFFNFSSCF